ncbi:uncharacterized mitochondrial protein AtMg00810-like [Miscanthus floridulus]|uniref:uncharacterized mitochondrial protein AtMg00810-like n=1 Tax=Miscanthus floridulus TaxID=154761 RepID=UPI0034576093
MAACFRKSDLGALSYYLGIEVRQGTEELTLGQSAYASKLLERSGMAECKLCVTPMEEQLKLTKASTVAKVDATLFRSIVDGLCYLVHTRPDIVFAMGYVNMVEDIDGRRSTSGVLVFLGSTPISWPSLKQKVMALSTCDAEYVAVATAACQVVWLRRLLGELIGVEAHPPALMVDN